MNFVNFFLYNKSTEHLTTLFLFILLIFFLLVLLWLLYKRKNFSLYTVWRLIDLFIHLIIALLIFRVISLPFALIIWFIWYISNGLLEDNKRKLRYINYVANNNIEYTKAYNYIHCSNDNKGFFESLKENVFISKNKNLNKWVIDKKKIAWKKTFLPFGYFIIGLIYPSINLLINGSQFSSLAPLPLRLLEINIAFYIYNK